MSAFNGVDHWLLAMESQIVTHRLLPARKMLRDAPIFNFFFSDGDPEDAHQNFMVRKISIIFVDAGQQQQLFAAYIETNSPPYPRCL